MRQKLTRSEITKRLRAGAYHDGSKPLSSKRVARLKCAGRYHDALVPGLYLQISESGARSWLLRFELHGRERAMGLGSCSAFSLAEARTRARAARQLLADGIDPLSAKQAARTAAKLAAQKKLTFAEAAQRFFDQHERKWRSRSHRDQFLSSLRTYAYPTLGEMDVSEIATADVLRAIEPAWTVTAVTADRVRNRIEQVIDWAVVRGHRPPGTNPARWRGHLDQVLPAPRKVAPVEHHESIDYRELPALLAGLEQGVASQALRFLVLCASRSGEVLGATWPEVDLTNATWTVPASRMKGGRPHRVPLSSPVLDLLRSLPREDGNDFLFIGPRAGHGLARNTFQRVMKRAKRGETVHGFRSTFRTWCSEQTNFPREICEQALAHATGNAVEQAYVRSDLLIKRMKLMEQWAKYCLTSVTRAGEVVPIGGGAR